MDQDKLSPELEKLLKQVKLKEPPKDLMADYAAGINAKIDQQAGRPHFGFPHVAMALAIGLVFAGVFYFVIARPLNHNEAPVLQAVPTQVEKQEMPESVVPEASQSVAPIQDRDLSLEEELTLIEAFEGEFLDEEDAALGDEDLLEELALLDELEISNASGASIPSV